jgi:hypothetical protein
VVEKIKSSVAYILGVIAFILGALFYAQRRKTDSVESELATEKSKEAVKENDHDRQIAKENADNLVADYERRKREYDESKLGGDGKL